MKKFFALTIALIMVIPSLSFAAELPARPKSCDFSGEAIVDIEVAGLDVDHTMQTVLAVLKNMKSTYKGTYIQKSDVSLQAYVELEIFAGIFYLPFKFWIDMDYTPGKDRTCKIIMEMHQILHDLMSIELERDIQYVIFDYTDILNDTDFLNELPEMASILEEATILNELLMDSFNEKREAMIAGLMADIKTKTVSKNHYQIMLTDEQMKELIIDAFNAYLELLLEILSDEEFLTDVEKLTSMLGEDAFAAEDLTEMVTFSDEAKAGLEYFYTIFRGVTLLSDNFVYEYKANNKGILSYEKMKLNMIFDIDDWIESIVAVIADVVNSFFDSSEKIDIYDSFFDLIEKINIIVTYKMNYETSYKNINTAKPIMFPILTEDNCLDIGREIKDLSDDKTPWQL